MGVYDLSGALRAKEITPHENARFPFALEVTYGDDRTFKRTLACSSQSDAAEWMRAFNHLDEVAEPAGYLSQPSIPTPTYTCVMREVISWLRSPVTTLCSGKLYGTLPTPRATSGGALAGRSLARERR